ncbi:MAG: hypothetical protein QG583_300 [Patescibacteria group bacterium]|nr:hypothetical protein [Patescibacteria group bacterium]
MGIFSTKKKEELVLLFDIGSSSVGGALFYKGANGTPKIIYSVREPILLEDKVDIDRFLILTLDSLKKVASHICMKGLGAPRKIFCVLSSPWHASQTRVIHLEKEEPFIFTGKMADELIAKEIKIFEAEHKAIYQSEDNQVKIIELKNIQTRLNGYNTLNPFNKKTTDLELITFISISEEHILKKIRDAIARHFSVEEIVFSTFLMSSFTVARDIFVNQDNFLLVNIGGEVTDISMIKKEVLRESISFPMGRNFMIRGIATLLNCTLDEARVYISLYKDGHMEDAVLKKFEVAIEKLRVEWLKGFQTFLSYLSNDVSIPSTIFITVDQDLVDFFSDTIKSEQFNQYILTESKFRVIFLGNQALHGVAIIDENVSRDTFLIIESIYINRFLS